MNILSIFLIFFAATYIIPQKVTSQESSVSFQVFYDELSPYGTWVDNPDYGYVWIPNVAPGFSPYATNGYWVFTDDGWTWVSNYSWGWAPFHYGRWYTDETYGPIWVPGYEWGPGWVSWRKSADYYGWAPIGPRISIVVAYGNGYNEHYNQYTFVHNRYFGRRQMDRHFMNYSHNITIINNSTVINNTYVNKGRNVTYHSGPERTEVEKRVGRKITQIPIRESNKPGQIINKNQIRIYRPQVQQNIATGKKPAPLKVESMKNLKTSAQRSNDISAPGTAQPNKSQSVIPKPAQNSIKQVQTPQQNRQTASPKPVQTQPVKPVRNVPAVQPPHQSIPPKNIKQVQPQQNRQTAPQKPVQAQPVKPVRKVPAVQPHQSIPPKNIKQVQPQQNRQPAPKRPVQAQPARPARNEPAVQPQHQSIPPKNIKQVQPQQNRQPAPKRTCSSTTCQTS